MHAWLYQMSVKYWRPEEYRTEVWEGQSITWESSKITPRGLGEIESGDGIVLFFAPTANVDPGIYGWGIIHRYKRARNQIEFQVTYPSDYLKMDPIWNDEDGEFDVIDLMRRIRGKATQGTMWGILPEELAEIRKMIRERLD